MPSSRRRFGDGVGRHAEDAGDGEQGRQQSHDAKRSRCGTRREEHESECVGPSVDGEGQAGVDFCDHAIKGGHDVCSGQLRTNHKSGVSLVILSEGEEDGRAGVLGQGVVLAILNNAHNLVERLATAKKMPSNRRLVAEHQVGKSLSFTNATLGVLGPSSQVKSRPASSRVSAALR